MDPLYYKETGTGLPLVFLHGFCETHEIWKPVISDLAKYFRVIVVDLPGFGNSAMLGHSFSVKEVAFRVIELFDSLKIQKCILIGHSLGGYVALAAAANRPDLFAGLCLFHSTAASDTEEKKQNRNKTIEFVRKNGPLPFVETFVPGLFFKKDQKNMKEVYGIAMRTSKEAVLCYSKAMRDRPDMTPFIHKYEAPILFLAGDRDAFIPVSSLSEQAKSSPQGKLVILRETGHMGMYEDTEGAIQALKDFSATCFQAELS